MVGMPPQKHVIDSGATSITSTTKSTIELAKGVLNPDYSANPTNVRVGSIIKGLSIQLDVCMDVADSNANPVYMDWYIGYNIDGAQTQPNPGSVGSSDLMSQVFHEDGCLIPINTATSVGAINARMNTWRLYVKIPRSWEKLMRGDIINLVFKFDTAVKMWLKAKVIYYEVFP